MPKKYEIFNGYLITHNPRERTYSIYSKTGKFLSTVNDGELSDEIRDLEEEKLS